MSRLKLTGAVADLSWPRAVRFELELSAKARGHAAIAATHARRAMSMRNITVKNGGAASFLRTAVGSTTLRSAGSVPHYLDVD
jgi:hypothetical protein